MDKLKKHLIKDIQATSLRMKYASAIRNGSKRFDKTASVLTPLSKALKSGYAKALTGLQKADLSLGSKLWSSLGSKGAPLKKLFSYHNIKYPVGALGNTAANITIPGTVELVPSALGGLRNLSLGAGAILLGNKFAPKKDDKGFAPIAAPKIPSHIDYITPVSTVRRAIAKPEVHAYDTNVVRTLEKIRLSNPERYSQVINAMPSDTLAYYHKVRNSMLGR